MMKFQIILVLTVASFFHIKTTHAEPTEYKRLLWQQGKPPSSISNEKENKKSSKDGIDFSSIRPRINWNKMGSDNSNLKKFDYLSQNEVSKVAGKEIKKK